MSVTLGPADFDAIERSTQQIGREILSRTTAHRPRFWNRQFWDDRLMEWSMGDEAIKLESFRFVDALPTLQSPEAVVSHLKQYFHPVAKHLPWPARIGLSLLREGSILGRVATWFVRQGAQSQAGRFIAGTNVPQVLAIAKKQRAAGRAFTIDILGEAVESNVEADRFFHAYLDLMKAISPEVNRWPSVSLIDNDDQGPIPRVNLSIKLTALDSQADAIDPIGSTRRIGDRLATLLREARKCNAFINVDMESYEIKDLTLAIFKDVLAREEFRDLTDVGIVIQCYLRDSGRDLIALRDWAKQRGAPVWVRLVKGAYWDYETTHARQNGWPIPVFQQKWESDANYEMLTRFVLLHREHLRPAIASHNMRSLAHAMAVAKHLELPTGAVEYQMLYGMADGEKAAITSLDQRVRVYMPHGDLIPGMAYLVRRLLENTSNDSFLRASLHETRSPDELLEDPASHVKAATVSMAEKPNTTITPETTTSTTTTTPTTSAPVAADSDEKVAMNEPFWKSYRNEPHTDFSQSNAREAMQAALASVANKLGGHWQLVIDNEKVDTPKRLESHDPSNKNTIVGTTAAADLGLIDRAVRSANAAQPSWNAIGASARGMLLRNVAMQMRRRRFELMAWQVYECGKGWREADGDVAEAIDFCEYYAAGAEAMEAPSGLDVPGEINRFVYLPRGVAAIIAPWNFPLAILTGMTVAALATGNTVLIKPAEQSAITGALLMEMLLEAGVPSGVASFVPGEGSVAGAALVDHPLVDLIAFTGSREVGLAINARAAEVSRESTRGVKRVIAEMGGKNAIVVDESADLDEAVSGVVKSAFGYQGQKCSACSRAIVLRSNYPAFLERLVESARSLKIGPAADSANSVGPVIDADALAKIHRYIELGRKEGREVLAVEVGPLAEQGYFVGPHIFADISPMSRLAQEEVFGPVLAVIPVDNFEDAIRAVNGTQYALTGAIFSRTPLHLQQAEREMMVGNLYVNRGSTGALVGRQPFGGFKMSGIGSKAGGPDYLLQFVVPKTVTENTMRRGFAPEVEEA